VIHEHISSHLLDNLFATMSRMNISAIHEVMMHRHSNCMFCNQQHHIHSKVDYYQHYLDNNVHYTNDYWQTT
jgi:hypothetical protein